MKPDRINRPEARHLADEEFRRFAELTASLSSEDWAKPTDCTAWDVRKMALHVLGSADAQASVREFAHQLRIGVPLNKQIDSHHWVDGMNELQIRERDHLSNTELVNQLGAVGPKAVKGRWGTPPPIRHLPIPFGAPLGWKPLKYLLDVGFTRDIWCHRIDICCRPARPALRSHARRPSRRKVRPRRQGRTSRGRRHRLHPHPRRSPPRRRHPQPSPPPLKGHYHEDPHLERLGSWA